MQSRNGTTEQNGRNEGNGDMFCRSVVAAIAAVLAFRLCQYVRKMLNG